MLEDYDTHNISTFTRDFPEKVNSFDAEYKLSKNKKEVIIKNGSKCSKK